jgi:hypothetical protein
LSFFRKKDKIYRFKKSGDIKMELDVSIDNDSFSIHIDNPFSLDLENILKNFENFAASKGCRVNGLDIKGLIPKMVRGIAGCENGCPADALSFISEGFKNFELAYIEGGILTAKAITEKGKTIFLKMFPHF